MVKCLMKKLSECWLCVIDFYLFIYFFSLRLFCLLFNFSLLAFMHYYYFVFVDFFFCCGAC